MRTFHPAPHGCTLSVHVCIRVEAGELHLTGVVGSFSKIVQTGLEFPIGYPLRKRFHILKFEGKQIECPQPTPYR